MAGSGSSGSDDGNSYRPKCEAGTAQGRAATTTPAFRSVILVARVEPTSKDLVTRIRSTSIINYFSRELRP